MHTHSFGDHQPLCPFQQVAAFRISIVSAIASLMSDDGARKSAKSKKRMGVKAASKKSRAAKNSRAAMNAVMTKAALRNKSKRQIALDAKRGPVGRSSAGSAGLCGHPGCGLKMTGRALHCVNNRGCQSNDSAAWKRRVVAFTKAKGRGGGGTGGAPPVRQQLRGKGGGAGGKQGGNGGKAAVGVHSIKKKRQATKKPTIGKQAVRKKTKKKAKKKAKTAKGKGNGGGWNGPKGVEGRRSGSTDVWVQYDSLSQAALKCELSKGKVSECAAGKKLSASGWVFRYADPTMRPTSDEIKRFTAEAKKEATRKSNLPETKKERKRKRDGRSKDEKEAKKKEAKLKRDAKSEDEKEAGRLKTRQREDEKKARALLQQQCSPHTKPAHTVFMDEASKVVEVIAKKPKLRELLLSSSQVVIMDTSVKPQVWSKDKSKPEWYMSEGAKSGGQGANLCRAAFLKCDVNRIGGVDDGTGTCNNNNNNETFATLSIPLQLAAPPLSPRPPLPDRLPNHHFTFPPSTPFLDFTFNR
jgi:hypothetical protein